MSFRVCVQSVVGVTDPSQAQDDMAEVGWLTFEFPSWGKAVEILRKLGMTWEKWDATPLSRSMG